MTTIYLMRHGQTLFNTQKRVQGWCDSPLTELGIEQAKCVGQYFKDKGITFEKAYSSTQERATDTLKLVTDAPYEQVKGLKEMSFGIFEAREEELLPKHRPSAKSFEDALVAYGGENILDVGERVKVSLLEIAAKSGEAPVLAVSHGAAMWGLMQILDVTFPEGVFLPNCAICQLEVEGDEIKVLYLIDPSQDFKIYDLKKEKK